MKPKLCIYCGGVIPKEVLEAPSVKAGIVAPLYDSPACRRKVHRIKDAISLLKRESAFIEKAGLIK